MKKYKLGYTQGTYDMFHIGHLNLLRHAKEQCERLIVGVNADTLVLQYKNKIPVVNEKDRAEIIKELRCVDDVRICSTLSKMVAWNDFHFDAIFIGDDWRGSERWLQTEKEFVPLGVDVVYLKHTEGVSSTLLRTKETEKVDECP